MSASPDILVFTDNKESANLIKSFVNIGDYFIHFASKDEEGIRKLSFGKFDLIIVEISQPLYSEITFIDSLYQLNNYLPIVIVSEYFNETRNTIFGNRISDFIAKPLTMEKLFNTVKSVINPETELSNSNKGEIEDTSRRLSFLYEISKSLTSITDFDILLNTIIRIASDALNCERATVFVLDKLTDELWSRMGTGLKKEEIRFPKTEGIAGEVVMNCTSIITDDPYSNPLFNKKFDEKSGFKTKNLLCVPMKNLNGDVVGAFQLLNKNEGRFTKDDELFLSAISSSTAIALENVMLHEERKRKVDDMRKLYDDLYTAQNMIVWETKHSTISEIRGFIKDIKQYENINTAVIKLNEITNGNKDVLVYTDKIKKNYDKVFNQIGHYLNKIMNDLHQNVN
jgi:CheY-like chemotaxis protein